jgi:hypothetical protein
MPTPMMIKAKDIIGITRITTQLIWNQIWRTTPSSLTMIKSTHRPTTKSKSKDVSNRGILFKEPSMIATFSPQWLQSYEENRNSFIDSSSDWRIRIIYTQWDSSSMDSGSQSQSNFDEFEFPNVGEFVLLVEHGGEEAIQHRYIIKIGHRL